MIITTPGKQGDMVTNSKFINIPFISEIRWKSNKPVVLFIYSKLKGEILGNF